MRGAVAKVHLLTDGRHGLPGGTSVLAPSLKYLERAYDAAKAITDPKNIFRDLYAKTCKAAMGKT